MINIRFEINGRRVDPRRAGSELERMLYQTVVDDIKKKVGSIRDPETGRPPKITVKGRNLVNISIEVEGSETMIEKVKNKLR